jgi:hypothetical protein
MGEKINAYRLLVAKPGGERERERKRRHVTSFWLGV